MKARKVVALILAGGHVKELGVLLKRRSKAALPFGGMYRIIDFPLTNLSISGIPIVGILSQYRPSSLMDHVGVGRPWDYNQRTKELLFLPPQQGRGPSDWYKGTADAVYQNLEFLERYEPDTVLILSGDHVYCMDYGPLLEFHDAHDADLTMVFKPMDVGRPSRFGIGVLNEDSRLKAYVEKPDNPPSNLASLTIYAFRYRTLVEEVTYNARHGRTFHLYTEVIPRMIEQGRSVWGYLFEGPWKYLRTPEEYLEEHMAMARRESDLYLDECKVVTNLEVQGVGDAPPSIVKGETRNVLLSPGSLVMGTVRNSVLGPWIKIEEGAIVEDSVLMGSNVIGKGAYLRRAIVDKGVVVGEGAVVDPGAGLGILGWKSSIGSGVTLGEGEFLGEL